MLTGSVLIFGFVIFSQLNRIKISRKVFTVNLNVFITFMCVVVHCSCWPEITLTRLHVFQIEKKRCVESDRCCCVQAVLLKVEMYSPMGDVSPRSNLGFPSKPPFSTSFGYFPAPLQPPILPPPLLPLPPPPISTHFYPLFLERQKEVPKPGAENLPFKNNQELTQLPYSNIYSSNRELSPNGFNESMRDFPYSSYTEIVPFADCINIGYPLQPGRVFNHVEEYHFANHPSIGEHPLFKKAIPRFGEYSVSHPEFNKSYLTQPGTFDQHLFGEIPESHPDLQFCRYSSCSESAKSGEYSAENSFNGCVRYSETVNILCIPSMGNSSEAKTEKEVSQGCVLISQSQVYTQKNYTSMFRQFSFKKKICGGQQQQNDQRLQN